MLPSFFTNEGWGLYVLALMALVHHIHLTKDASRPAESSLRARVVADRPARRLQPPGRPLRAAPRRPVRAPRAPPPAATPPSPGWRLEHEQLSSQRSGHV